MVLGLNKKKIAQFSDILRDKLSEETKKKAAYYGILPDSIQSVDKEFEDSIVIGGKVFNKNIKRQREQLVSEIKEKGYVQVMDEITYTWFNRFMALKFMEVNGYLPENVKVFSSVDSGRSEPDILSKSLKLDFLNIDRNTVIDLKSAGKDEELYKYLTLGMCNYLNKIMPFLFENIEDHTELLFPDKLLHTDSILRDINGIIEGEDWKEVELIGWIYQDYINPRKDRVFADLKKNIKISKENIPAATQLFTPKWIVKYLVENSVGRLWLESNPNKELQSKFKYYIEQETRIPEKRIVSPEEIAVLDPAKGSGHILVYTFEVLYEIYRSQGYLESEIAPLILNKNLYGLEIDDRAAQLAGFALMMKARMYDKDLFNKKISLNLCAIQETREECTLNRGKYPQLCRLWDFFIDAKNYGSILKVEGFDFERLGNEFEALKKDGTLDSVFVGSKLEELIKQAKLMGRKYHCVVTNPPYMGTKGMNAKLADFVKKQYPDSKSDLFAVFIEKCLDFTIDKGFTSMITMQSWMYISAYDVFRSNLFLRNTIDSLMHLGARAFDSISGEIVQTAAFVIKKEKMSKHSSIFIDLTEERNESEKQVAFSNLRNRYEMDIDDLSVISVWPLCYKIENKLIKLFSDIPIVNDITFTSSANVTGDNNRFLKYGWEINYRDLTFEKPYSWFPCAKGGEKRKWFGNIDMVIAWSEDAHAFYRSTKVCRYVQEEHWNKAGITWSRITSSKNAAFRLLPPTATFETAGMTIFPKENDISLMMILIGYLNSPIAHKILRFLNPTLTLQMRDVLSVPFSYVNSTSQLKNVEKNVYYLVEIAKSDWNSYETSWDFTTFPLLKSDYHQPTLKVTYSNLRTHWQEMTLEMQRLEEENNRIFIEAYGLQDEMMPEVPLKEITLTCNPHHRYNKNKSEEELESLLLTDTIKQFISYAVGCMFGRYSPDKPGLILANQGETIKDFREKVPDASFMPDDDNIIPILDDDYFTDDIVGRFKEFLKVTFGAEALSENLDFIAGVLSKSKKSNASPEKVIRDYFLKDFFKDHVKMYKKRPIYWLFTSGKGRGFNALVYMHRYNRETLAKMRTDYLLELEAKLDARIGMLGDGAGVEKGRLGKQVAELVAYDEKLNHKSLQMIEIDLDDGVKVNYAKFEGLVEKI